MKKTTLILTFVLAATIAWADNKGECLTKAQVKEVAKETTSFKQQSKKEKTERKDLLDTVAHILKHATDTTLRVWGVVVGHVLGERVDVYDVELTCAIEVLVAHRTL